jgi:hypothetical protein
MPDTAELNPPPAAPAEIPQRPPYASPHRDVWTWVAEYADGTTIFEMDDAGYDVHGLKDVDLSRVVRFTLIPLREGLPTPTVQLDQASGQRLIFTRRRRIEVNPASEEVVDRSTTHLLGWQRTVEGRNVKGVTYWFEDGSCLVSDHDQHYT